MSENPNLYKGLDSINRIKLFSPEEILTKTKRVKESFIGIPIYKGLDGYPYSNFRLTDFSPPMEASLVEDMTDLLVYHGDFKGVDLIVSEADRGGGPLSQSLGLKTGIPYTLANWYPTEAKGAQYVGASIGFSGQGNISIHGIKPGQNVILINDMLSSGGTAEALIKAILQAGANIIQALFVGEKVNMAGRERLQNQFPGLEIITLVRFISLLENGVTVEAN